MKRVSVVSLVGIALAAINVVEAAEWKMEPSVTARTEYNDNPRLFPDESSPDGSAVYTLNPRLKLKADEFNDWDMSLDMNAKMTRYQDVEDADNNNIFLNFDSGSKTELTEWRLAAKLEENTNFDTDFETKTPDAGLLLDDKTLRKTLSVTPSMQWSLSQTSFLSFNLSLSDVRFEEVRQTGLVDYEYDSAQLSYSMLLQENHRLGLTGMYAEFDSPENKFSYDQTVFSIDYTYTVNESSEVALSVGTRSIESLVEDVTVACSIPSLNIVEPIEEVSNTGECPILPFAEVVPVIEDVTRKSDGTVVNLSYDYFYEAASLRINGARSVIPSSFGGVQEENRLSVLANYKHTERLSSDIKLSGSQTDTLNGVASLNDRDQYQFQAGLLYKLTRDMSLKLVYNYIEQTIIEIDQDSSSNAIMVNLYMQWPRLATTY